MELKALEQPSTPIGTAADHLQQVIDFVGDVPGTRYDLEAGLLGIEADDLERRQGGQ